MQSKVMFKSRWLEMDDYPMLVEWWSWFRFPPPTQNLLPENGEGGMMIGKNGIPICAGFLYLTNSDFAIIEYVVSNPEYRDDDRKLAIQFLLSELERVAKTQRGKGIIFSFVRNENLINRYMENGYTKGTTSSELVKLF